MVDSTVANLGSVATGNGSDTLNITSGTLVSASLSSIVGYSTINVTSNAAHVIALANTALVNTSGTVTVTVTSTIGVRFDISAFTGTQLKAVATLSEAADSITGGPDDDTLSGGIGDDSLSGGAGNGDDLLVGGRRKCCRRNCRRGSDRCRGCRR
jgi:Ca2+-binding RTX toxin-like protein